MSAPTADEPLALRAAQGGAAGQAALAELYGRHHPALLAFLTARRTDDAEAVAHDVWLKVWQALPRFDGKNFRALLFRAARNQLIDLHRRKKATGLGDHDAADPHDDADPAAAAENREQGRRLAKCMDRLPEQARGLMCGRLGGDDYPKLCAKLGLTPNQAYGVYHKAVAAVRDCVEGGKP